MFLAKLAQKVCFLFIRMVTETQQARKTYPLGVLASPISHVPYYSGPTAVTSSVLRTYAYVLATVLYCSYEISTGTRPFSPCCPGQVRQVCVHLHGEATPHFLWNSAGFKLGFCVQLVRTVISPPLMCISKRLPSGCRKPEEFCEKCSEIPETSAEIWCE